MRSIKNKLGYSCIIGISAIALSLSIINNLYSDESDSTKCIINKNGKIVYNTESSKSDCSSSIFELYNKFENTNKAKNNGNIDTKVLGLDDIKNNQDSSGGGSGESGGGGSGGTENPDDQDIVCIGLTTQDNAEAFTSTTLKYKETPLEAKCLTDETIIIKASCNSDKTWNIEGTCPTPEAQCKASDLYNNIELLGGDKTKTSDKTNVANLIKCTDNTCNEKTGEWLKVTSIATDMADSGTYYTINQCLDNTTNTTYDVRGNNPRILSCLNGQWSLVNSNIEDTNLQYCAEITLQSKCWSASGGMTTTEINDTIQTNNDDAMTDTSYKGFMDTDCCNVNANRYVSLDLKLKRALGEKEEYDLSKNTGGTFYINETKYNNEWKDRSTQEKLIKYASLSNEYVDLRCMDLSNLNMSEKVHDNAHEDIKNLSDTKATNAQGEEDTSSGKFIHKFNTAVNGKTVAFSYRPRPKDEKSSLNDGSNLSKSNFSGVNIDNIVYFGANYYSSGNPGSNLTNADFSNSTLGETDFGYNDHSYGNPGSNLSNANFSGTYFVHDYVCFACNWDNSTGNPETNLTGAKFAKTSYGCDYVQFAYNDSSLGNPTTNLQGADFSDSKFTFGWTSVEFATNRNNSNGDPYSNLNDANFSNTEFNDTVNFGANYGSSGNPHSELARAKFSNAIFGAEVRFAENERGTGDPMAIADEADFSGSTFGVKVFFASNTDNSKGNPVVILHNVNFDKATFNSDVNFAYNEKSFGNPFSDAQDASFRATSFNESTRFGENNNSVGNPHTNLMKANFSEGSKFNNVSFGYNNTNSFGNPGSNLMATNFSGVKFNNVSFGANHDSSGNPGSNLNDTIFEGSTFSGEIKGDYSNVCRAKSFDTNNELVEVGCFTGADGDVDDNVYNPYCALNPTSCCAEYNEEKVCINQEWDGRF